MTSSPGHYRQILESLNDMIFELDNEWKFIYFNPALAKYLGYTKDELFQTKFPDLVNGYFRKQFNDFYKKQCNDKVKDSYLEFPMVTKNGSDLWVGQNLIMSYGDAGRVVKITAVARDINRSTQNVASEGGKPEGTCSVTEEVLSTLSHEIRTPLNAIMGMSHLLLEENPAEHQIENLNNLKFSAHTLLSLINNVLDFNKIESNNVILEKIPFNFFDLITNICNTFSNKAEEKKILLNAIIDTKVPKVLIGDPMRLTQILSNLLSNALKFTRRGHVKLKIAADKETDTEVFLNFSIEDTGIGIPKRRQKDIFERFTQASKDTSRKFGGTGLGLAITKKLIELHGNSISVKSTPPQGTVFTFDLAFGKGRKSVKARKKLNGIEVQDLTGVKVLVVEDDEINQVVMRKYLNMWKATADIACNGHEALKKIRQNVYNIIFMDIQMAEMNGYDTTKEIKKIKSAEKIPILALTADANTDIKTKVLESGMDSLLVKPIDPMDLKYEIISRVNVESSLPSDVPNANEFISFRRIEKLADGDSDFFSKIVKSYINELCSLKKEYAKVLYSADNAAYNAVIHKIKSALIMIEANLLLDELMKGEKFISTKDEEGKSSNIKNIERLSSAIIDLLEVNLKIHIEHRDQRI